MSSLFKEEGASLRIEILSEPEVTSFIDTHSSVLNGAISKSKMSDKMRSRLEESNWIFSGMKTFHELNEAFPSMLDENGNKKPFERFLKDVQSIDERYNKQYLRAEYGFAEASAQMASKWERFAEDGDEYNLQYRTAGDDAVRPEHAALEGVTLPQSDRFWDSYWPLNGWNCRCTVVQVLKNKYPVTPREEAMRRGKEALAKDKKGMFKFNSGKEQRTYPAYNPYTTSKCKTCDLAKMKLAAKVSDNELCEACIYLQTEVCGYEEVPTENGRVRQHRSQLDDEKEKNVEIATYLANKYGHKIDLIPRVDNVYKHKNADAFNHTLGYKQEFKVNSTNTLNAIDMAIRDGSRQANSIVIRLDSNVSFENIAASARARFRRKGSLKEIILIMQSTDARYDRETILSEGFKIQQEDFK